MSAKETRVTCPCCQSRLEVDARTGQVVTWNRATELDETGKPVLREADWDEAARKVSDRMGSALDKFDSSLEREANRTKDLDDLFRKAQEKLENKPED